MLQGSDSDDSFPENEFSEEEASSVSRTNRTVLRPSRLHLLEDKVDFAEVEEQLSDQSRRLERAMQEQPEVTTAQVCQVEIAKLQAATCMDLRKEVGSIEKFGGEVGDLNHFLRSGDRLSERIAEKQRAGKIDASDAQSLTSALVRRVHRGILNRLQADDETAWAEIKSRLQKEYGGGRWTPEEDALRMLRYTRARHQTKGDFAAQLLRLYQGVVNKYRETLTGPEATAKIAIVETLAVVQLGEAVGKVMQGSLIELANGVMDAAGRGEEEESQPHRREWRAAPQRRERQEEREAQRRYKPESGRKPMPRQAGGGRNRTRDDRRCYSCGQQGHLQAKCAQVKCYECQSPGHMARSCPYMRAQGRGRGEPMEVNLHEAVRPRGKPRKLRTRENSVLGTSESEEGTSKAETSEEENSVQSYATVMKKGRVTRAYGGRKREKLE